MTPAPILKKTEDILKSDQNLSEKLSEICRFLNSNLSYYDWVGFYFANHKEKNLHLGPYAGEPTDHKIIPFGKGICGQVAESHETFLVEDVNSQNNYIACSINVKSEIVVPLFVNGKNVGQIDIDSHTPNAFSAEDEKLLKTINALIAEVIENENFDVSLLYQK